MYPLPQYLTAAGEPPPEVVRVRVFTCSECGARLVRTAGYACARALHGPLRDPQTMHAEIVARWPLRWRRNVSRLLVERVEKLLPPPPNSVAVNEEAPDEHRDQAD